ncbi:hypothetical protein K1719_031431 [Acacia pycnantha]|nr:hypothetical protein K1719_031431 [Acacia pycnantha]
MDSFLFWNNQGSCGSGLYRNIKPIINGSRPSLVVLADTRCSSDSRLKHLLKLGFDSMKMILSIENSGGRVAFWKSSSVSVTILEEDRQFVHRHCSILGTPEFLIAFVYALTHSNFRDVLWRRLKNLEENISMSWMVCGDFNDILNESERISGVGCNHRRLD